jgi:hypothetical protein
MRCISPPTEFLCRPRIKKTKAVETRLLLLQCLGWNACESVKRPGSEGSNRPVVVQVTTTKGSRPAKSPWTLAKEGKSVLQSVVLAKHHVPSTWQLQGRRIRLHFADCCSPMAAPTMETVVWSRLKPPDRLGRGRAVLNVDPHTLSRAVQYFDIIARSASEAGVAIDVFCNGALELGYPATKRWSYRVRAMSTACHLATPISKQPGFCLEAYVCIHGANERIRR